MPGFHRLAIADRDAPAMRCLAAVADLNAQHDPVDRITTIALHCDTDRAAWFVRAADEAASLEVPTVAAITSDAVVRAVRAAGADAVWVGWGRLSGSDDLVAQCEQAGIVVVGPGSAAIARLHDPVQARALAERCDVTTVPWATAAAGDVAGVLAAADGVGYPVVVRTAPGGGSASELRIATSPDALGDLLRSYGDADADVVVERWFRRARQVEVQLLADTAGTVWALGVRDSSVQRRAERVLQESRCVALDAAAERTLSDAAVAIARAASYVGVGAAEFLVDLDTREMYFHGFHPRLQAGHPVTEATTGVDLVALGLDIARGRRLDPTPPAESGHAIGVRVLAADPEHGFAAAGGRLSFLQLPTGPGVRVDTGLTEGDVVDGTYEPVVATLVAHGRDRSEALARLRRSLSQLVVLIDGGTTTKAVVAHELASAAIRSGDYDCGWLDRVVAEGLHLPPPDPLALVAAAIIAYDEEEAVVRDAFLASAARLRPDLRSETGHRVQLRLRGHSYRLQVYRTGPDDYRVDAGEGHLAAVTVRRLSRYELAMSCHDRQHRVVVGVQHTRILVEIDGVPHVVERDDGVLVRADAPALIVEHSVRPGDHVAAGDPLLVLESMKMTTTVVAPASGVVAAVLAAVHTQVDVGASLVQLTTPFAAASDDQPPLDLGVLDCARPVPSADEVHARLRALLLGFDVDPGTARRLPGEQRQVAAAGAPDDRRLLAQELGLLDIFTDICALSRRDPDPDSADPDASPQEHLFTYLSRLDPDRSGVPASFVARLRTALRRYGVDSLARTPALERSVVQMYRSFQRSRQLSWIVTSILERWLKERDALLPVVGDEARAVLNRLVHVAPGRADDVAELAREVRYRFVEEPLLERATSAADAAVRQALVDLAAPGAADPSTTDALVRQLVNGPRPLRAPLRDAYLGADDAGRRRLLEVRARRFYRICTIEHLHCAELGGFLAVTADVRRGGDTLQLVSLYAAYDDLGEVLDAVEAYAAARPRPMVLDVETWRHDERGDPDTMAAALGDLLDRRAWATPLHRVDVTVTSAGAEEEHRRTQHFTFGRDGDRYVEDVTYRNLHPMLAERLELWRWVDFDLQRMPTAEDVYLFDATAKGNAADTRLVAIAEVRDLTPATTSDGTVTGYPLLERMLGEAFTSIRHALAARPRRDRPLRNRVVLYVRPEWRISADTWRDLAHRIAPLTSGLGLEKVQVRVHIPDPAGGPDRDAVIEVSNVAERGVTVRVRPPSDRPIGPMTPYAQRVLKAQRAGAPYPYELVNMLTPPADAPADFPPGRWVEHDLMDEFSTRLAPVDRDPGRNTCGIVAGVLTSYTPGVPEGMARVALLGDPTRGLGNLAEAECRRILGALDLAEQMRVPLEWYALSSGARIAMDSGTENMDWISAVLRRIIEFTQAGGEINVVVTGINVGAQPYWNAEATMLMHTRGVLVMTPSSAMVLTGKSSLDYSGGVSAEDNTGIGGFERVMGPNGQGQYWAPTLGDACALLLRHYEHTYVVPGELGPRRAPTSDPVDRDVRAFPHRRVDGCEFELVGDVFSDERNPDRKNPFDMRSVMRAVTDADSEPLERWSRWRDAETAIVWDARIGGIAVCLLGIESRPLPRSRFVPADGPPNWTAGTLFPQSSRKLARAINSASGNRPLVVLANLSGFDGSPESMRKWQLEYGAEIGRAVTNFRGPIVFVVVSRYHGGAFVVFSKRLNEGIEIAAIEGSYASVIGGAPAAAVVFAREVTARTEQDPRVVEAQARVGAAGPDELAALRRTLTEVTATVHAERLKEVADEFDAIHDIRRAQRVGSVDLIVPARELRPYVVGALERGLRRAAATVTLPDEEARTARY